MPIQQLHRPSTSESENHVEHELTPALARFIDRVHTRAPIARDEPMIHVSSTLSGAAIFYERLRYSIDFREEHLLRRHALERILRRRFELTHTVEGEARQFLIELIHAQYLKNDAVPESAVSSVQKILDKYAAVFQLIEQTPLKEKEALKDWFYGLASAELEDFLSPSPEEDALVELMSAAVERDQPLKLWQLPADLERTLTFIATYRALFAFDVPTLNHLLLRRNFSEWEAAGPLEVNELFPSLLARRQEMNAALTHPAGERLWRVLKSRAIVFHALADAIKKSKDEAYVVLSHEERIHKEIQDICNGYYKAAGGRRYSSAVRSTLYILITKVIIALVIEAPLEQLLYNQVNTLALTINLSFPPVLMFVMTMFMRMPGDDNTKQVWEFTRTVLYGSDRRVFPELKVLRAAGETTGISTFYLLMFFVTYGLIAYWLLQFGFSVVSAGLFLFFLSVVSFFAMRVRQPIRDLFVSRPRDNVFTVIIDFFSLPILKVGRQISLTSARFNVFLFLFDYFLEAPFKAFLLLTEDVLGFFREKREDIL